MFYQNLFLFLSIILLINTIIASPQNDKALFDDDTPESRRKHRRPCRGRTNDEGRTFFDWSYQLIDVNYNYNYNINCDGIGGGSVGGNKPQRPHKPHFQQGGLGQNHHQQGGLGQNHHQQGGGLFGNKPSGGLFNGNGLSGVFSQLQSNNGLFSGQILNSFTSLLPQNGLFNGQGVSSLFDGGLFNNIFGNSNNYNNAGNTLPTRPPPIITTTQRPLYSTTTEDPDDMIYNDERPVHEAHDPVVPDPYSNYRPGQYLIASNPLFGDYVHDLFNFDINPNKIVRQINKGVRRIVRPLTHLLKR